MFSPPSEGAPAKNLYTNLERLTLSCGVTWTWSARVDLENDTSEKDKNLYNMGPGSPSGPPVPGNLYRLPRPLVGMNKHIVFRYEII